MKYIDDFGGSIKKGVGAAYSAIARFKTANLDVLMLDIENVGASPLTGFKLFARVSHSAPMRDITPASWVIESALVWQPAQLSLGTLAAAAIAQLGLNVAAYESIEIQAVGTGAVLSIAAGGYGVGA